jgi:hypothetical protein
MKVIVVGEYVHLRDIFMAPGGGRGEIR